MAESKITAQSDVELVEALAESKRELFNLRFQLDVGLGGDLAFSHRNRPPG